MLDIEIFDPALPQLQQVLNESYMRDFFQYYFHGDSENGSRQISGCQIIRKRYKPGKRCIVTYALNFGDEQRQPILFGQILKIQETEKMQASLLPRGVTLISELAMLLWQFPDDPKLRSLGELMNPERVQELLPQILNQNLGKNEKLGLRKIEPLKYVPRKQCVLSVEVEDSGGERRPKILGKIYADARGSNTFDLMQQLWVQQSHREKAFAVVEPLGYDAERRILWQAWSPGEGFISFAQKRGLAFACSLVAKGLADLHRSRLAGLPTFSQQENFAELCKRADQLMKFHRELETPLSRLVVRFNDSETLLQPAVQVPIHADFNYSQILFEEKKVVVIDLDTASVGDPLYDLAHFVAGLYWLNIQGWFPLLQVRRAEALFCQIYQDRVPWNLSKEALRAQLAAALIFRRAYKVLRQLEAGAFQKIEYYLNLAIQYLN